MRVLLIAEACNPEWTSVPLVGWSHARAIARHVDAHLVVHARNQPALLRVGLVEGRDFTALDSDALVRPAHRLSGLLRGGDTTGWTIWMALSAMVYPFFEHLIWRRFGRAIHDGEFDLVHRLTPLSPTVPSPLAHQCRRAGVPFLLGPLNGGVPWPPQFDAVRRQEREWLSYVRGAHKLLPGFRSTRIDASALLIGSRDTWKQMPRQVLNKCFYMAENGIDPERFHICRTRRASRPIKVIFVGRLVPYKGADMLLDAALPLLREGQIELQIIGDGPERDRLWRSIEEQNLNGSVQMPGWVAHQHVQEQLAAADVFAFPSIREFGGGVVLEAMAVGLVPVVVNYAGPAELVTDRTGFRIPMGTREQIVAAMRQILQSLADNPDRIDQISTLARERARRQFSWDAKAEQVVQVYRWVLDPTRPKPQFPMPTPDPDGEAGSNKLSSLAVI